MLVVQMLLEDSNMEYQHPPPVLMSEFRDRVEHYINKGWYWLIPEPDSTAIIFWRDHYQPIEDEM